VGNYNGTKVVASTELVFVSNLLIFKRGLWLCLDEIKGCFWLGWFGCCHERVEVVRLRMEEGRKGKVRGISHCIG